MGGVHGCAQIVEDILGFNHEKRHRFFSMIMVFLFVTFAWIFFRADTIHEAFYVIYAMFKGIMHPVKYVVDGIWNLGITGIECVEIGLFLSLVFVFETINLRRDSLSEISRLPKAVRWGIYYTLGALAMVYGIKNIGDNPFVYFQF